MAAQLATSLAAPLQNGLFVLKGDTKLCEIHFKFPANEDCPNYLM